MSFAGFVYTHLTRAFFAYKAATLLHNALVFPRLRPAPTPLAPRVSLLIPARNEAVNLTRNLPGLLGQGAYEVLVLDDHSVDDTARVASRLGARVLEGEMVPAGWHGKTWACHQLAGAARGDILIFTDADVSWNPGALGGVLHELQRSGADLLSVWPRQTNVTPGERLLTPLAEMPLLSALPFAFLRLPSPWASAANGQVMCFRRAAYEDMGGHAAVRAELLEDVKLAHRLRENRGILSLALGRDCISVRMYHSYLNSVEGFGKNFRAVHGGRRDLLSLSMLLHLLIYTLPWLVRVPGWRWLRAAGLMERPLTNSLSGRRSPTDIAEGLVAPALPLLLSPVYVQALRRKVVWKGRKYEQ